jgi:cytochrome P450
LLGIILNSYGKVFHEAIHSMEDKYGDIFSFKVLFRRIIIVSRIDYIEEILSKRQIYEISEITTRNFSLLFPDGLLSLKGDQWKRHARVMLPVFRRNQILPHFETIVNCIDDFIDQQFSKENFQIHQNLVEECQNVLLRIIARIAFNFDFSNLSMIDGDNIHQSFNEMINCASQFGLMTAIPLWFAKLLLKFNWKFQRALKIMKHYVMIIINDEQKRKEEEENDFYLFEQKKTLIRSLIESSRNEKYSLNKNEIFDEISMSILAGFETTSTALSWFIYYISKYPNVQQKMKDELKEHGLTSDVSLTNQILDKLIYVDCVMKEVLRFAPIAAGIVRQAIDNDIINGIEIKKGDIILIAIQNLHQNSNYWKINPKLFYPERFLHQDKYPPKYAYLPFGGGHRQCIGQDLAILELKIAITRLMQRVTFEDPGNEQDNSGGFTQRVTCFPKHMAVRVIMDSII